MSLSSEKTPPTMSGTGSGFPAVTISHTDPNAQNAHSGAPASVHTPAETQLNPFSDALADHGRVTEMLTPTTHHHHHRGRHTASEGDVSDTEMEDDDDDGDRPVSPNMAAIAQRAAHSPHRFAASAQLFEMEPRSRVNRFVKDEEGCVDMADSAGADGASLHTSPGSRPATAGFVAATSPMLGAAAPPAQPVRSASANSGSASGGNNTAGGAAASTTSPGVSASQAMMGAPSGSLTELPATGDSLAFLGKAGTGFSLNAEAPPEGSTSVENEADRESREAIIRRLRGTQHLSMLPRAELEALAAHLRVLMPKRDDILLEHNAVCNGCYIILRGKVAVFRPSATVSGKFDSQWWLGRGDMFGFDFVIVAARSQRRFQAMSEDCVIGFMDHHTLFKLIRRNPPVAHSIARKMSEDMSAFKVFKEYARQVFAPTTDHARSVIMWRQLLEKFGKINNGIYPEMHAAELDTGAWTYALRRLPDNITQSHVVELSKAPPPMMASLMRKLSAEYDQNPNAPARPATHDGRVRYVGCKVRRRPSYQLGNGKTLVLLRDSTTDLIDFTSCMCVHMNESEKLRNRLLNQSDPSLIPRLNSHLGKMSKDDISKFLESFPFSKSERTGLVNLWGENTVRCIFDIVTTRRDDLLIRVDLRAFRRFYRTPSSIFASNIKHEILRRLGLPQDGDLPDNIIIDIISSNAHSVKNLLSPFPRTKRDAIMAFAKEKCTHDCELDWHNREDLLYYVLSKYVSSDETARHEFGESWLKTGLTAIEQTAMTGLEVDVVDVRDIDAAHVDGFLQPAAKAATERLRSPYAAPHFIVNLDFPFGAQAESVMKSLSHTFGSKIRSMNVMGKGGGLVGKRGDLQFPTHVLYSKSSVPYDDFVDELRACGQQDISPQMLHDMTGGTRGIHVGPVVTIAGTMSQNSKLLRFYKNLWGCVGMEMEGSYFARALRECTEQGVLRPDIKTRFLYYTSDTPLQSSEESLAAGMTPTEGVPSSYSISRAFLHAILSDELGPVGTDL
eukprot:CAMPEP_0174853046 /NCGR_PEP_ID=MMETSP1114-20130205/27331_1 /TAXON_ID=312471 /ORGANISM="Neobodo designis, Strain CCAP 1951/1" /LENGTH=1012 /DNA_ID=CAMNT_0016087667 /DNA_START=135 /DNA_END=3173 /DNA_ORIENTATION=-